MGWVGSGEARRGEDEALSASGRSGNEPPYEIVDSVRVEVLLHCGQPEHRNAADERMRTRMSDCWHGAAAIRGVQGRFAVVDEAWEREEKRWCSVSSNAERPGPALPGRL